MLKVQKKTTVKPLFNPKPYKVLKAEGPLISMEWRGEDLVRYKAQLKLLKDLPERLISKQRVGSWKL